MAALDTSLMPNAPPRGAAPSTDEMRLVVNGRPTSLGTASPDMSLLAWLRGPAGLTGTKEGCGEGDCGACTVLLEAAEADGAISRRPVNACLLSLGQLDGLGVRTVEGLAGAAGLHPVQDAFAQGGGTQCGFCTPGFVVSAYAYAREAAAPVVADIHDALAGNLCRCTGYRPIVEACMSVTPLRDDPLAASASADHAALAANARTGSARFAAEHGTFAAPRTLAELLVLRAEHPAAQLIAGGTDVNVPGLYGRSARRTTISLGNVAELRVIEDRSDRLTIGATVTYAEATPALVALAPALGAYLARLGSVQVRNVGTLGGNLGTASPIGDMLPVFLALEAEIEVASGRGARRIAADDFFRGYRVTALEPDEVIVSIRLPRPQPEVAIVCEKISKRRDQDISTVSGCFAVERTASGLGRVRLAFGGMAGVPKRARAAEAVLSDRGLDAAAIEAACAALPDDLSPLGDLRGRGDYRLAAAQGLLRRFHLRLTDPAVPLDIHAL